MSKTRICSTCSTMIPDADVESGAAIALLGKNYCATCKGQAAKEVSLDDLMEGAPPRSSDPTKILVPPGAKTVSPPPAKTPPPGRPGASSRSRRRPFRKSSSKGPLIAVIAIVVVAAGLGVVVMNLPSGDPKKPPANEEATAAPPTPAPETADAKVHQEFVRVETLSRRPDVELDAVLEEIRKIEEVCKGTHYQSKLEMLRNNTIKQKNSLEATKALEGLVEKLSADIEADKDFRGYARLMERLRAARQTASKGAPKKLAEIQKIQAGYSSRYEKVAQPFFSDIQTAAAQLARERRYDDALAQIDRFPVHLRHSGAWNGLQRLKREIEQSKKRNSRR